MALNIDKIQNIIFLKNFKNLINIMIFYKYSIILSIFFLILFLLGWFSIIARIPLKFLFFYSLSFGKLINSISFTFLFSQYLLFKSPLDNIFAIYRINLKFT